MIASRCGQRFNATFRTNTLATNRLDGGQDNWIGRPRNISVLSMIFFFGGGESPARR